MTENRNNADLRYTFDVAEVDPKRQSMSWSHLFSRSKRCYSYALRVYPKCRCAISASGFTTQMVISRSSPGGLVVRDLLAGSGMTAVVA
ncbi:hypothetical protein QQG55_9820 [Brugia pahangi]